MYWVVLILTYYVEDNTVHSHIYFKDMETCYYASNNIYPIIYEHYEFSMSRCRDTDLMQSTFMRRPKLRNNN